MRAALGIFSQVLKLIAYQFHASADSFERSAPLVIFDAIPAATSPSPA
jgi:hypothetical protein